MTTLVKQNQIWNSMPGWGIVADLTPPELISGRKLRFIRKVLALGLLVLVILLTAAYVLVRVQTGSAADALAAEQLRTTQLTAQQSKYGEVTQVQTSISDRQKQLGSLMSSDVDVAAIVGQLKSALPTTMTLSGISISASKGASGSAGSTSGSLDTTGHKPVASVTLTGHSSTLADLAKYVDALRKITGVTDVLPSNNQDSSGDVQYTVSLALTDQVLSHYFDVKAASK